MSTAARTLYERLKAASDQFGMLRQEPYFSTVELDELVTLAAHANDATNWLQAQRDTAEDELAKVFPGSKWADAVRKRSGRE